MSPTLEELSRTLALIHEAAASPERWTDALAALTRLCETSKASILDVDAEGRLVGIAQVGHDPAAQKEYAEHYFAVDPTAALANSQPPGKAIAIYERFPAAERARSEYFQFAERADLGDVLGLSTRQEGGGMSIIGLQRPVRAPAFDAQAKRLFELIAPHIQTAKNVHARVAEALAARDALAAGLDRLVDATFLLDDAQRICFMNRQAERLLAADARLRSAGGKLAFGPSRLQSAFQAAVRDAAGKSARSRLLMLPANGVPGAEIAVCALAEHHPLAGRGQAPRVLVVISAPRQDAEAIAARMRQLYGLTPAEGRLVGLLALGKTVEEIALETRVRESTLRSQLKTIRVKTGTNRQADVVRLALAGARLV